MAFIHSLVMTAFVGPRPPGLDINHKNGVNGDNRLENLEYATHGDNVRHAYDMGLKPRLIGGSNGAAILTEPDVRQIKAALAQGKRQCVLAEQYGVSRSAIHCIASNKKWRHVA